MYQILLESAHFVKTLRSPAVDAAAEVVSAFYALSLRHNIAQRNYVYVFGVYGYSCFISAFCQRFEKGNLIRFLVFDDNTRTNVRLKETCPGRFS